MRDIAIKLLVCFFFTNSLFSQVGIGTTNPSAELEIETSSTGIPSLELNPQVAPTGTADGQLAVIGDKLYMYDLTRAKWLSTEVSTLHYARSGSRTNEVLRYNGVISNQNSGPLMPFNGTIVYAAARSNNGDAAKAFSIEVRNGNTLSSNNAYNLTSREFTSTNLNIDFNAGDYIISRIGSAGANVSNLTLVLWVKWRQ